MVLRAGKARSVISEVYSIISNENLKAGIPKVYIEGRNGREVEYKIGSKEIPERPAMAYFEFTNGEVVSISFEGSRIVRDRDNFLEEDLAKLEKALKGFELRAGHAASQASSIPTSKKPTKQELVERDFKEYAAKVLRDDRNTQFYQIMQGYIERGFQLPKSSWRQMKVKDQMCEWYSEIRKDIKFDALSNYGKKPAVQSNAPKASALPRKSEEVKPGKEEQEIEKPASKAIIEKSEPKKPIKKLKWDVLETQKVIMASKNNGRTLTETITDLKNEGYVTKHRGAEISEYYSELPQPALDKTIQAQVISIPAYKDEEQPVLRKAKDISPVQPVRKENVHVSLPNTATFAYEKVRRGVLDKEKIWEEFKAENPNAGPEHRAELYTNISYIIEDMS